MIAPVLIAKQSYGFGIGEKRDGFWPVDGIKIRDERDGNPIVSADAVIAAEDYS